jgi:molybdopterin-guanine dinucleotide biosynthesis protein A
MPMRTAIILAGGTSSRVEEDKAILPFHGKMLIEHGLEVVKKVCDTVVIACRDEEQKERFKVLCDCVIDQRQGYGPLEGIYQGCAYLGSGHAFVLACDMPFVSGRVIDFLFESALGHSAAIPAYPWGRFEPLHSVYDIDETRRACRETFKKEKRKIFNMIDLLPDVVFVSTDDIKTFDPHLKTFININTRHDLEVFG